MLRAVEEGRDDERETDGSEDEKGTRGEDFFIYLLRRGGMEAIRGRREDSIKYTLDLHEIELLIVYEFIYKMLCVH